MCGPISRGPSFASSSGRSIPTRRGGSPAPAGCRRHSRQFLGSSVSRTAAPRLRTVRTEAKRAAPASVARRARAGRPVGRRAAVQRHEPGEGSGMLLRWHDRGAHQRADADLGTARGGADVGVSVQGAGSGCPSDRRGAQRRDSPGRERPKGRQPAADHGRADRLGGRLSSLVPALRPQSGGRVRRAG